MKRKYALEEASKTGCPPEIEVFAYDRVHLVLEGEGEFFSGHEEGDDEVAPVEKDDVVIMSKDTAYDYRGRMRLFLADFPAYEQDSDIRLDELWD